MSLILNETLVLAKTRSQDLKSVLNFNCWGSGIKDVSLVRQLVNVEVIGLSCNEITTLEDFAYCTKLKELILRKNKIKNISEVAHLQNLPKLTNLWLGENPCVENTHNYRKVVLRALPNLTVLDNIPVTREELQEIEELGNEIYEEIQYESSNSSGSGPSSTNIPANQQHSVITVNNNNKTQTQLPHQQQQHQYDDETGGDNNNTYNDHYENDLTTHNELHNQSALNESHFSNFRVSNNVSRSSNAHHHPSKCLSLQGSITTLNGNQNQNWSLNNNNNNNNNNNVNNLTNNNCIPPRGGRSHTGNILSAVLCLVKELDYTSCEVVQTALNCRMEETSE